MYLEEQVKVLKEQVQELTDKVARLESVKNENGNLLKSSRRLWVALLTMYT